MPFPRFLRRLFQNDGAGPLLNKDIIPSHADTHAAKGGDPITPSSIGAASADDLNTALQVALGGIPAAATATPKAPGTAAVGTSTKYAREDHVHASQSVPAAATATPKAPGTAAVGTSAKYAREDHVHALQTTITGKATINNIVSGKTTASANKDGTYAHKVTLPSGGTWRWFCIASQGSGSGGATVTALPNYGASTPIEYTTFRSA